MHTEPFNALYLISKPFNSLFEMLYKKDGDDDYVITGSFNSLFEMHSDTAADMAWTRVATFNSLFEMRQIRPRNGLRCCNFQFSI